MSHRRTGVPHPGEPYFAEVADALGDSYLRYDFTKGTAQEVRFLVELLGLERDQRVLDVGCGPGRHALDLARRGLHVTGVDVSARFLQMARSAAAAESLSCSFFQMDARDMPFEDEFDAVVSLCQGGFGLMGDDDGKIAREMATALRPGGHLVLTAFNAYFEARHARPGATLDIDRGIVHETTSIKTHDSQDKTVDLWTGVYTPKELRLLSIGVGLVPVHVWSVEPGAYARRAPSLELPELMLVARKP